MRLKVGVGIRSALFTKGVGRVPQSAKPFPPFASLLLVGLLYLLASTAQARPVADPLPLETFPGSRTVLDQRQAQAEYTLALGLFRRVDAQWQAERERRLSGTVVRQTLELPSGYTASDGMEFYREQLQGFSSRLLFSCSARECGSSSRWANQHFGVIQLHGLEQYQYYAVYEINHAQRALMFLTAAAPLLCARFTHPGAPVPGCPGQSFPVAHPQRLPCVRRPEVPAHTITIPGADRPNRCRHNRAPPGRPAIRSPAPATPPTRQGAPIPVSLPGRP